MIILNPTQTTELQINTSANGDNGSWVKHQIGQDGAEINGFILDNLRLKYLTNPTIAKKSAKQSPFILDDDELEIYHTQYLLQFRSGITLVTFQDFNNNLILLDIPGSIPYILLITEAKRHRTDTLLPTDIYSVVFK